MKRFTSLLALPLTLAACGYTPMYAPQDGTSPAGAQVTLGDIQASNPAIGPGERRGAQEVYRELHQRFPSSNPNLDRLDVSIVENQGTLAVERNATVARANVSLDARLTLTDVQGHVKLNTRLATSAAYNVQDTPFSTESGRTYARLTASRDLAEEIARRVVLFYRQGGHPVGAVSSTTPALSPLQYAPGPNAAPSSDPFTSPDL